MVESENKPQLIELKSGNTCAVISTEGSLVTHFEIGFGEKGIGGYDVIFPDQYLLKTKKRRGGIPVLGPNAGPLSEQQNTLGFNLEQHGFMRDRLWEVTAQDKNSITMELGSDQDTEKQFPYHYNAQLKTSLSKNTIRHDLTLTNHESVSDQAPDEMPFAGGLHGYMSIPTEIKKEITTNLNGFDPKSEYWKDPNKMFYETPQDGLVVDIPGKGIYRITTSPEFKKVVVWTEEGYEQICFEPWIGGANALLDPEQRLNIPKGESVNLWVETSFTPV